MFLLWEGGRQVRVQQENKRTLGLWQGCGGGFPGACKGCKVGGSKAAIKRAHKSTLHPRKHNAVPRPSIPAEALTGSRCLSPCCYSQPPYSREVAPRSQGWGSQPLNKGGNALVCCVFQLMARHSEQTKPTPGSHNTFKSPRRQRVESGGTAEHHLEEFLSQRSMEVWESKGIARR